MKTLEEKSKRFTEYIDSYSSKANPSPLNMNAPPEKSMSFSFSDGVEHAT